MVLYNIKNTKDFMNRLLLQDSFDGLLLIEATVTTFSTFHIDGVLHPEFYARDEDKKNALEGRMFSLWGEVRKFCLELIKGKFTPLGFQIVLGLPAEGVSKLAVTFAPSFKPSDISGLYLNIRYTGGSSTVTTGTSLKTFTLDKTLEHAWDEEAGRLLSSNGVEVEHA